MENKPKCDCGNDAEYYTTDRYGVILNDYCSYCAYPNGGEYGV